MPNCPVCQKPVDPLRSRHVSVRDGKIVAYCSAECLASAQTQPVKLPAVAAAAAAPAAAPAKPMPALDSEPVIQIVHEPASAPVAVDKPHDKPRDKKAEKKAEKERRASEQRAAEKKPAATAVEPESAPTLEAIVAAAAVPTPKPADKPAEPAEPAERVSAAKLADAAATKPKRSKRSRRDSIDAKSAWEWLDEEPAAPMRAGRRTASEDDGEPAPRGSSRGIQVVFVLGILAVLAAGGYFFYDRYLRERPAATPSPSDAAAPLVTNVVPVDPDAAAATEDPAAIRNRALDNAQKVLRTHLETGTDQIREKAALALSRARDDKAIAYLADALLRANTDTKRLEIAYALARAKDPRGREALVAATKLANRDTRADAGKKLALLGDKAAIQPLANLVALPQHRHEAGKALALLGDKQGFAALEQMRKGSPDERTRAAIALVQIGKPGSAEGPSADERHAALIDEVVAILTDDSKKTFRHHASLALAEQRNAAARPTLVENLRTLQTQSEVARALRRLDPAADLSPQIATLEERLLSEKDLEQIHAADAILLLAGPAEWAERP